VTICTFSIYNMQPFQFWKKNMHLKFMNCRYHAYRFEEDEALEPIRNVQRGGRRFRVKPHTQVVEYAAIHFGFNKLILHGECRNDIRFV